MRADALLARTAKATCVLAGLLTWALCAAGCRNVPTERKPDDVGGAIAETPGTASPSSSAVATTSACARPSSEPPFLVDAEPEPEPKAIQSVGVAEPEPDLTLEVNLRDWQGADACSISVDPGGTGELEAADLRVLFFMAGDDAEPTELESTNATACVPVSVSPAMRDVTPADAGLRRDASAEADLDAGFVDAGRDAGPSDAAADSGLDGATSLADANGVDASWPTTEPVWLDGWYVSHGDADSFVEFCPDACSKLRDSGGRLLIEVRWGVRFPGAR